MRTDAIRFGVLFLLAASALRGQTRSQTVCVIQTDGGRDALLLARQLAGRKLSGRDTFEVIAITGKSLPPHEEHDTTRQGVSFARVILANQTKKAIRAANARLGCDYDVKVWYHENVDDLDQNAPVGMPSPMANAPDPMGDRTVVAYELRDTRTNKVLAHAAAPPRTVYVRQGRRVFDPYPLFANQIVKKLDMFISRSDTPSRP